MIKQNPYILSILEPKACWHKEGYQIWNGAKDIWIEEQEIDSVLTCRKCLKALEWDDEVNPDYYTATGIQDIKKWLVKEKRWGIAIEGSFHSELFDVLTEETKHGYRYLKDSDVINKTEKIYRTVSGFLFNIGLDPELFVKYFIAYAKENKLGDLSLIQEEEK